MRLNLLFSGWANNYLVNQVMVVETGEIVDLYDLNGKYISKWTDEQIMNMLQTGEITVPYQDVFENHDQLIDFQMEKFTSVEGK